MNSPLLSVSELFEKQASPHLLIVDCRFDLANPKWGRQSYREGHIPGAIYASLDEDLSGPIGTLDGRHPLPDINIFVRRLEASGIGDDTLVVVYDTTGGSFAGRLWWLLRYLGHDAVVVLDGGWQMWQRAGYAVEKGDPQTDHGPQPVRFTPRLHPEMVVSAEEVNRMRSDPSYLLVDARAPERFRGEQEPIDPVAGRIPGAVNRFHMKNLQPDRTFLPAEKLHQQFLDLLAGVAPQQMIVYCGSGVTSIHHLMAMEAAGLPIGKLYAGSWSEWIRDPAREIARG